MQIRHLEIQFSQCQRRFHADPRSDYSWQNVEINVIEAITNIDTIFSGRLLDLKEIDMYIK